MSIQLNDAEARVIGVLLEKSITTPEQYPLSLNALTNGCNQKSNRLPITQFSEDEVIHIVDGLKAKRIVQATSGYGSRVDKYSHRFCNTEFGDIKLSDHQLAIIIELLLRGPQTPGELRGRSQRLATFSGMGEVEATINSLLAYQPSPLVYALPREPGKREERYHHTFIDVPSNDEGMNPATTSGESIDALRDSLNQAKLMLSALEARIDALASDQD